MTAKRIVLAIASLGLVSVAGLSDVSARGVAGAAGRPVNGKDMGCFSLYYDGVINRCSSAKVFEVPLPVDKGGTKSITFAGKDLQCRGEATNQLNGSHSTSPFVSIGSTASTAGTASFTMPGAGKMWLNCTIQPGGQLLNVNYAQ